MTNVVSDKKEDSAAEFEAAKKIIKKDIDVFAQHLRNSTIKKVCAGIIWGAGLTTLGVSKAYTGVNPLFLGGLVEGIAGVVVYFMSMQDSEKANRVLKNINEELESLPSLPEKKTSSTAKGAVLKV